MFIGSILFTIGLILAVFLGFYYVLRNAIRDGIDSSVIGKRKNEDDSDDIA